MPNVDVRPSDRLSAMLMHASARFTVRYGDELRFAGEELPRPRTRRIPTRDGNVRVFEPREPRTPRRTSTSTAAPG